MLLAALALYCANGCDFQPEKPAPTIVSTRPQEPDRLSPQLRNYLLGKIKWVDSELGNPKRHRVLGTIYEANQLWQEAFDSFTTATTLDPTHALTQYHRARSLIGMGRLDEAEAMLAALVRAHPDLAPAACRWGELLLDRGLFEEAGRAFALVSQHSPKAPHGYVGQAAALVLSGSYRESIGLLDQALARYPEYPRTHYLLGLAYRGLGRRQEALASLKLGQSSVVEELPDDWSMELARHSKQIGDQVHFAESLRKARKGEQAIALLEEALRWNPDDVRVLKALALTSQALGQCEGALPYLAHVREVEPHYPGVALIEAACLIDLDRVVEAEAVARKAISLEPTLSEPHMLLAFILSRLVRNGEALEALARARQLDPTEPHIALRQGQLSVRMKRREDARRYFEEVVQLAPTNVQAHLSLARLHASQGHWRLAQESIQRATGLEPANPRVVQLARSIALKRREQSP